jgi:hypothetical protein
MPIWTRYGRQRLLAWKYANAAVVDLEAVLAAQVAHATHLGDPQRANLLHAGRRMLQIDDAVGNGKLRLGLDLIGRVLANQEAGTAEDRKLRGHIEDRAAPAYRHVQYMLEAAEAVDDHQIDFFAANGIDDKVERFAKAFVTHLAGNVVDLNLLADAIGLVKAEMTNMLDDLGVRLGNVGEIDHPQPVPGSLEGELLRQDRFARARWPGQDVE